MEGDVMKVIILCGGRGMRLNELTETIPKPLVKVQGKPILWHICNHYKKQGHNDFVFCLGYKGDLIRTMFKKYPEFNIIFVNTGADTSKTGRLLKVERYISDDNFLLSYGDDICDVDINHLINIHQNKSALITLTAVPMTSDFGVLDVHWETQQVMKFEEKPKLPYLINGGYYVCSKEIFYYIKTYGDFEKDVLPALATKGFIYAWAHDGKWKSKNTLKDVVELNETRNFLAQ